MKRRLPELSSQVEIAWLAGILEGEGSFMMWRSKPKGSNKIYKYPTIIVTMTDEDVIQRVASMFGLACHHVSMAKLPSSRKQQYRAVMQGEGAVDWMRALLPHMGLRRSAKMRSLMREWDERTPADVLRRESCRKAAAGRRRRGDGTFEPKQTALHFQRGESK